jgi:hypothetical protein
VAKNDFDRLLDYLAKSSGWIVFRSVYWALYLFLLGILLLYYSAKGISLSLQLFFGWAFTLLGLMIIFYGAAETLHHKLMRKYS